MNDFLLIIINEGNKNYHLSLDIKSGCFEGNSFAIKLQKIAFFNIPAN